MLIPGAANSSSFSHEDNETNTHTHTYSQPKQSPLFAKRYPETSQWLSHMSLSG